MLCVLLQQPAEVPLVEDDQVVQTLSAHCADDALSYGVSLRRVNRTQQRLDAEFGGAGDEGATVATVAVPDQITRLPGPGRGRDELAPDPLGGRMGGDVEMDKPPPVVSNEEEDIQRLQADSGDGEEVCPDVRSVVAKEGAPGLRWRPPPRLAPVAADRLSANLVAEFAQFAADADAAPARVLPVETLNEGSELRCQAGAPRASVATLPGPVTPPGGAVPADDCIGLDDDYCRTP